MRRTTMKKDFDFYIDEYLYYCQSRRLRQKTLTSYEQTLRLFERWLSEQEGVETPQLIREQTVRRYICELQDRGKYSFYCNEKSKVLNGPERRRDYRQPVSVTTVSKQPYSKSESVFQLVLRGGGTG